MKWEQISIRKIRGLILFTIAILVALWNYEVVLDVFGFFWGIIFPFVLGGAIAFIINVPMSAIEKALFGDKEERKGRKAKFARPVSLVLTLALAVGIIAIVLFVLIPQLGDTFASLGRSIAAFIPKMQEWVDTFTNGNKEIMEWVDQMEFNPDKMIEWGVSLVGSRADSFMNSTFSAVSSLISGLTTFFIGFSFAIYILFQKEKLHVQVKKVFFAFLPKKKAEVVMQVCALTYKTFYNFLTGQCMEAVILGCMFVVTMAILKLPYALLIGIVIAFAALIPIFGAFIGCGLGFFMIFMVSPKQAIIFIIVFLVLQQVEGNLVYPHVVGNSVGLPSIWVLAAVSIGGSLMGIVGMLIFIPMLSVVYTLFRAVVYLNLKNKKIKSVTADEVIEYTSKELEEMKNN